jgi:hypothetical protein
VNRDDALQFSEEDEPPECVRALVDRVTAEPEPPFPEEWPWLEHLDADDQAQMFAELAACFGRWAEGADAVRAAFNELIYCWRQTALVLADPELREALLRPSSGDDFGPVPPPEFYAQQPTD